MVTPPPTPLWFLAALHYHRWTPSTRDVWMAIAYDAMAYGLAETEATFAWLAAHTGRGITSIQRAVALLEAPAGEHLILKGYVGRGHHMLHVRRRNGATTRFRIVEDWRSWGWPARTDLEPVERSIERYESWTVPEEDAAGMGTALVLLEHLDACGLRTIDDPIAHPRCSALDAWAAEFTKLAARGFGSGHVRQILDYLKTDDEWRPRVAGPRAAQLLAYYFDGLLLRARRAS